MLSFLLFAGTSNLLVRADISVLDYFLFLDREVIEGARAGIRLSFVSDRLLRLLLLGFRSKTDIWT